LPALWVCVLAFLLSDEMSIYSAQMQSRSRSPAHRGSFVREILAEVRVGQFLASGQIVPMLRPGDNLTTVLDRLDGSGYSVLPVVDQGNRLLGVIDMEGVHLAMQSPNAVPLILAEDLMRDNVQPLTPDDRLDHAQELFVDNDLLALPVVEDLRQKKVIGMVRRFEIASAYLRHVHGDSRSIESNRALETFEI
jgi:chloride channel protein, CIC family